MNFSVCLLGVFLLVQHDICVAKVMITYRVADEIEKVYVERKKDGHFLGNMASLTQEERLSACQFYREGEYVDDEESKPHIYEVMIPDGIIPEGKKDEPSSPKAESSRTATTATRPMDIDPEEKTGEETMFEEMEQDKGELKKEDEERIEQEKQKLKRKDKEKTEQMDTDPAEEAGGEAMSKRQKLGKMKQEEQELKKEDEGKTEPKMIYNQDIAFRCHTRKIEEKDFLLSYGFAQEMYFVSEPVGELDEEKRFSGRKMKLTGYMFATPISIWSSTNALHKKYFDLRKRTEKIRSEFPALLDDIEKHDDISALTFQEKNILCASIMEIPTYKRDFLFLPSDDPKDFEYVKYPVTVFDSVTLETGTFDTDFLQCKATVKNFGATFIIGVTRSYAEGGDVFTSTIRKNNKNQFLDAEVTKIAVLFNRKYAGEREGVLEVLEAVRSQVI